MGHRNVVWQGVRLRRTRAGSDADATVRTVVVPASWEQAAELGLAALVPGHGTASLPEAAEAWIAPIAAQADSTDLDQTLTHGLADRLRANVLHRRGAPSADIWHGVPGARPGWTLNLPAFRTETGFDVAAFRQAIADAVTALSLSAPAARALAVGFADLSGLLASLGLVYDSAAARNLGCCLAALLRGQADATSAELAGVLGAHGRADALPAVCGSSVPGLADAARRAAPAAGRALHHAATTAIGVPGPEAALLGVETGGFAPAFSPLAADGALTRTAHAALAARGLGGEAALAAVLAGHDPFGVATTAAHIAMHDALAPLLHAAPPRPHAEPAREHGQELPARRRGYTQRAAVGGHTLFLRTGEYEDGRLGEISIAPAKESVVFRALMDHFASSVSIGLQHGVPLDRYVEAFLQTRFGPGGTVEGDPAVPRATSMLDYVFRHLAANYLHQTALPAADLPSPELEEVEPAAKVPLLPLDLPRKLRVVK